LQSQCDDGNQAAGDGCSSTCDLESGFTCDTSVQPTICKSTLILLYRIESILKNSKSNSAVIKLHLRNPSIYTFPVFKNQFEPVSSHIKLKIILSHHPYVEVPLNDLTLLSVNQKNEIEIQFSFTHTIEDIEGFLELNY
jgi:cysteine-rich repeat protein